MTRKPVPSMAELKRICWKSQDAWLSWKIYRPVSIRVTWLLGHTPITANGVTVLGMLFAALAWAMLATGDLRWMAAGALVFQVWVLLDHTDGEIARLRRYRGLPGSASVEGAFMEYVGNHLVVHPLTLAFLGVGAYRHWGEIAYLYLGFAASFASVLSMAIWLRKHQLLTKFVYLDPEHEVSFMGQTPEAHLRERGLSPAGAAAPAAATQAPERDVPRFSAMGALQKLLQVTSNFMEFSFILIGAIAIDLALAAASVAGAPLPVQGAVPVVLLYYGGFFVLATFASIFTNIRSGIAEDLVGYVAHKNAQIARARGEDVQVPKPGEDH